MQWKVQYLTNEVNMLEFQKAKATSDILKLNSAINQVESSLPLPQQREKMNQGNGNFYPKVPQPDSNWYSLDISYTYE